MPKYKAVSYGHRWRRWGSASGGGEGGGGCENVGGGSGGGVGMRGPSYGLGVNGLLVKTLFKAPSPPPPVFVLTYLILELH